jgi:hypothetical protein
MMTTIKFKITPKFHGKSRIFLTLASNKGFLCIHFDEDFRSLVLTVTTFFPCQRFGWLPVLDQPIFPQKVWIPAWVSIGTVSPGRAPDLFRQELKDEPIKFIGPLKKRDMSAPFHNLQPGMRQLLPSQIAMLEGQDPILFPPDN